MRQLETASFREGGIGFQLAAVKDAIAVSELKTGIRDRTRAPNRTADADGFGGER